MSTSIDPADVQGILLHDSGKERVTHFALEIVDPAQARSFIGGLEREITHAGARPADVALAIAFTFSGLQKIGLAASSLDAFSELAPAFCEGAAARARTELGDTGRNDPSRWDLPFRANSTHVLLSVYGDTHENIATWVESHTGNQPQAGGFAGWHVTIPGQHIRLGKPRIEHFGFRDGISQPTIKGMPMQRGNPSFMQVNAGEFLLGHENEDAANPWDAPDLPDELRQFVRNGSFAAFRKMQQNVAAFAAFSLAKGPLAVAKMCGRWPDGTLVEPGATAPPATPPAALNAFDFSDDKQGLGCPFGSHIRRLNPRADGVVPSRKRLLMRRGMPYTANSEKGLLGLFICASLEDQFEFLMSTWIRRPPRHPYPDPATADPLVGDQQDPQGKFVIPGVGEITGLPSFVTTRGTLYGFYPSRTALRMIGQTP